MSGERFRTAAVGLVAALALLAGCGDGENRGPSCPLPGGSGPALAAGRDYVLVAGSLSEEWGAIEATAGAAAPLPGRGLTGRAPNDLVARGDRLYIVNSLDNAVQIVDLATGASIGCIDVGAGANPWDLELDPADSTRAWLSTWLGGDLLELDLAEARVRRRLPVAPGIEGVLVTDDAVLVTSTAYRGPEGVYGQGEVLVFGRSDLVERARLAVPTNPQALLRGPDGRIHVVCTGNYGNPPPARAGRVVRIEADYSAVRDTLEIGGSPVGGAVGGGGIVYLASVAGGLLAYDGTAFTAIRDAADPLVGELSFAAAVALGGRIFAAAFDDDAVVVLDAAGGALLDAFLPGVDGPVALAARPAAP